MSFLEAWELIKKRAYLLVVVPVIFMVGALLFTLVQPKTYTTETSMYVLTNVNVDEGGSVDQNNLNLSQMVSQDIALLLTSPRVREDVTEKLGVPNIGEYTIEVENSGSRLLTLRASGPNPELTARVANATVEATDVVAREVMGVQALNTISQAQVPTSPSNSFMLRNLVMALLYGLLAAAILAVALDLIDTRLKSDAEIEKYLDVPVIGHFPRAERM